MKSKYDSRLYSQACFNVCQACGGDFVAPISCEECIIEEDSEADFFISMNSVRDDEYQKLKVILATHPEKLEEILTDY